MEHHLDRTEYGPDDTKRYTEAVHRFTYDDIDKLMLATLAFNMGMRQATDLAYKAKRLPHDAVDEDALADTARDHFEASTDKFSSLDVERHITSAIDKLIGKE